MSHIFYDVNLNRQKQKELLIKAHNFCEAWWFDELDCSKSFHRKKIEISFEESLSYFKKNSLISVVHRNSDVEQYLEVGFRSMSSPIDYFLWIIVPIYHMSEITKELHHRDSSHEKQN